MATVAAEPLYLPLRGRAVWARRILVVVVAVDVVAILSGLAEYRLLTSGNYSLEAAEANDARQGIVALTQVALFVAATVFFIRWFHRAYTNLPRLGSEYLRYRGGWAIGAWFVPILNLFRPKQIANDIWRGSAPTLPRHAGNSWYDGPKPALLAWWWAAFVVTNLVSNTALRLSLSAEELIELRRATVAYLIADAVGVVAGLLAIRVVARLTERQEARAEALRSQSQ